MMYATIISGIAALLTFLPPGADDGVPGEFLLGKASYYSSRFEGRKTAFGEVFRNKHFTAAHRTLPHNTLLEVVNLKNGKKVVVRVNDRGPWTKRHLIDISQAAARQLGIMTSGIGEVRIRVVGAGGKLFEQEEERLSVVSDAALH